MVYLHASPIKFHGNLKSSNVLLDGRWNCKITDFGLQELHLGEGGPSRGDPAFYYSMHCFYYEHLVLALLIYYEMFTMRPSYILADFASQYIVGLVI